MMLSRQRRAIIIGRPLITAATHSHTPNRTPTAIVTVINWQPRWMNAEQSTRVNHIYTSNIRSSDHIRYALNKTSRYDLQDNLYNAIRMQSETWPVFNTPNNRFIIKSDWAQQTTFGTKKNTLLAVGGRGMWDGGRGGRCTGRAARGAGKLGQGCAGRMGVAALYTGWKIRQTANWYHKEDRPATSAAR